MPEGAEESSSFNPWDRWKDVRYLGVWIQALTIRCVFGRIMFTQFTTLNALTDISSSSFTFHSLRMYVSSPYC